jgi:hypothetical protein
MLDHHIFTFEVIREHGARRVREAHAFALLRTLLRAARDDAATTALRGGDAAREGRRATVAPDRGPGRRSSCCAAPAGV